MQRKTTSKKVSKKTAKKPASRVRKKTPRKPVAKVPKKTAQRPSKKAPARPAEAPPATASKEITLKNSKRPILVPLDFSVHSEAALEFAADMAECLQSPIVALHVVHDPGDAPGYYRVKGRKKQLNRLEDVASDMLDDFMAKMAKRNSKRRVLKQARKRLVIGLPATRILEVAEQLKPRMVVMGSRGRTGLSRFLLGSKAEQLLRICPYPVTIVKVSEKKE